MATIKNFEELEIWKKSRNVTKLAYQDLDQSGILVSGTKFSERRFQ